MSSDGVAHGQTTPDLEFSFDGVSTSELIRWATTGRPSQPADIVDRIDQVTRLCPCGAPPDPEFGTYCSYACVPNWRGPDTITDRDYTPMRWRPDLVSAVDDTDLVPFLPRRRLGVFWVTVLERPGAEPGTRCFHLRVDDSDRFVGSDLVVPEQEAEFADGVDHEDLQRLLVAKWNALREELKNPRHQVAEDPERLAALERQGRDMMHVLRQQAAVHWVNPPRATGAAGGGWVAMAAFRQAMAAVLQEFADGLRTLRVWPAQRRVREDQRRLEERMQTLTNIRSRHNSGPARDPRAPRRIDPRRNR